MYVNVSIFCDHEQNQQFDTTYEKVVHPTS